MKIDSNILDGKNQNLYAQKRDIIIQTNGMKKSVHFIYPFYPLKQSELDQISKFDKSLTRNSTNVITDLTRANSENKCPLFGGSHLRFRPTKRVRADSYFIIDYTWYYQNWKNWNPFRYEITQKIDDFIPSDNAIENSKSFLNRLAIDEDSSIEINSLESSLLMQKIVLFIEPNDETFYTPFKIGNMFINRFAVDEDAAFEILKVFELEKTPNEYKNLKEKRRLKGMDLIIKCTVELAPA